MIFPEDFVPDPRQGFGIAFDVGTTTLAALLFDLTDGHQLGALTGVNPGTVCRSRCDQPDHLCGRIRGKCQKAAKAL